MNEEELPAIERRPVGAKIAMDAVRGMIVRVAAIDSAVLAGDEGGCGKQQVAESSPAGSSLTNGHNEWHGPAAGLSITLPIGSSLFDVERAFIVATLEHFSGDKRRAASALGCSVKTLYNKLHLYRRQVGHDAAAD